MQVSSVDEKVASLGKVLQEAGLEKDRTVWSAMLDLGRELARNLADLEEAHEDLNRYVETIDEDLTRLEGQIYGSDEETDEEETPLLELTCPHCHGNFLLRNPPER